MNIQEYYAEVRKHTKRVYGQLVEGKLPGQPKVEKVYDEFEEVDDALTQAGASLYVVSLKNRDRNSTAGQVSLVLLSNATRVMADGTHVIATAEQIKKHLDQQAENRVAAAKADWNSGAVKKEIQLVREPVEVPKSESKATAPTKAS